MYFYIDPHSAHKISFVDWPWNSYPRFLVGGAYLLTHEAIVPLLAAIQTTPMFIFEDVYITGICAEKVDVETKDDPSDFM